MKKFIWYTIFFIFPIALLSTLIEVLCRRIPNDYQYKISYLDSNANIINVLILGSSHAYYGINPVYLKYKAFNAAYISQSLDYDWEIIKKYDNHWHNLKCIVLPIDYFSFYCNLNESAESWRKKNYIIYEGIKLQNDLSSNTEILSSKFIVNIARIHSNYINHDSVILCSKLGWGTEYNSKKNKNLVISGKIAALRHTIKNSKCLEKNIFILTNIIKYAFTNKIKVLLITSPAYKTYVEALNSNQLNTTLNILNNLSRGYGNVQYYNLLNDKSFAGTDFYDADHLNEIGAKKLTNKIDSILTSTTN
jgi:hypothetical protein